MCEIVAVRGHNAASDVTRRLATLKSADNHPAAVAELTGERTLGAPTAVQAGSESRSRATLHQRGVPAGRLAIGQLPDTVDGPDHPNDATRLSGDCKASVMVTHCGTIDNRTPLREALERAGHLFTSHRDGELIAHAIEDELARGAAPFDAFQAAIQRLAGTWAVAALIAGRNSIFIAQHGSRLAVRGTVGRCVVATTPAATGGVRGPLRILEDGSIAELGTMWHWVSASGRPPAPEPVNNDRVRQPSAEPTRPS